MRFGELPEIMSEAETTSYGEFYYDAFNQVFNLSGEIIPMSDHDTYDSLILPMLNGSNAAHEDMGALISLFGTIITTPRTFTWLKSYGNAEEFNSVNKVMKQVFETKLGSHDTKASLGDRLFGFSCNVIREGHVELSVTGNCACCGPNTMGTFVEDREWGSGFAEYELHNIDFEAQHVALLAGLGHIALRAKCADL